MRFSPENILLYLFLELRSDELAEGSGVLDLYRGDEYLFCRIGIDKNRGTSFFFGIGGWTASTCFIFPRESFRTHLWSWCCTAMAGVR